jgi:hypothetical protein
VFFQITATLPVIQREKAEYEPLPASLLHRSFDSFKGDISSKRIHRFG